MTIQYTTFAGTHLLCGHLSHLYLCCFVVGASLSLLGSMVRGEDMLSLIGLQVRILQIPSLQLI